MLSGDQIPRHHPRSLFFRKLKLLSYFNQIFPKLSLPWGKALVFSPASQTDHTSQIFQQSVSKCWVNSYCTWAANAKLINVFPQPLEWSHQSSWSLSPGCESCIPEHGMLSSMPGTSWELCVCSWIMLHPRWCFLFLSRGKKNVRKHKTS